MGICLSCFGSRESEEVSDEETTHLLQNETSPEQQQILPQSPDSDQLWQDQLHSIVVKTAETLIDISSIRMLDRLQEEYAAERAQEYQRKLQNVRPTQWQTPESSLNASGSKSNPNAKLDIISLIKEISAPVAQAVEGEEAWVDRIVDATRNSTMLNLPPVIVQFSDLPR